MLTTLRESVRLAKESWRGCCWETEFGPRGLNLQGLLSRQAVTAAKATRGEESLCWQQAAQWLAVVEKDAKMAAELADLALKSVESGDFNVAIGLFDQAIQLAAKYPVTGVYVACRSLGEGFSCNDPATA